MKRKWFALAVMALMVWSLVGSTAAQGSFPQTPVLDNFNRGNQGPPPSASWTNVSGSLVVSGNECANTDPDNAGSAYWNNSYADSEVFTTITVRPNDGTVIALYCRADSTLESAGYSASLHRNDGTDDTIDMESPLGWIATYTLDNLQDGDSFGLRCAENSISIYYKSVSGSWGTLGSETSSEFPDAGYIGLRINDTTARVDNFGGGEVEIEPPPTPTPIPPIVIGELDIDLDFDAVMDYVNMILAGLTGLFELMIGIALGYAVAARLVRVWRGG